MPNNYRMNLQVSDSSLHSIFAFSQRAAEDARLTAQTLNSDGTPKRPMNAFMIFARKRRPQVSAENQMMRTGEISKLLSKEWNTMEMASRLSPTSHLNFPLYLPTA